MAIKNLAIFDIDGTLHKTEVMSLDSFRVVCAEYALPVPDMQTLYQTYGANEQTLMDLLGAPQDEAYRNGFMRASTKRSRGRCGWSGSVMKACWNRCESCATPA